MFTTLITEEIIKETKSFNKELRKYKKPPKAEPTKTPKEIRDQNVLKAISSLCTDYQEAIYKIYAVIINEDQDKYCKHMKKLRRAKENKVSDEDRRISLNSFALFKITDGNGDYHTFPHNEIILLTRGDYGYYWDKNNENVDRGHYTSTLTKKWKTFKSLTTKEVSAFISSTHFKKYISRMLENNDIKRMLIDRLEVE